MKITSNYPKNIYWRIFNVDDTVYAFGVADGIIKPGAEKIFEDKDVFKLEIKEDGLFGKVLEGANSGKIYTNQVEINVDGNGGINEVVRGSYQSDWNKIVFGSFIAGTYTLKFSLLGSPLPSGSMIQWRRYSVFPPFYTFGSHDMSTDFHATFVCDPYCDFWFETGQHVSIAIFGSADGCL